MEDISKKISEILSDPEAMSRIKNLAGMFDNSSESAQQESVSAPPDDTQALDGAEMLGAAMRFLPLLKRLREDDEASAFLKALRPLLSPERQQKLDEALKVQQIMKLVPMLSQVFGNE